MTANLSSLLAEKPVVLVLHSKDEVSLQVQGVFDKYQISAEKMSIVFVDKSEVGKKLEQESRRISKTFSKGSEKSAKSAKSSAVETELPHVYLGGEFFFGGQTIQDMPSGNSLRYKLIDVDAVLLPGREEALKIISNSKVVCFMTKFSAYSMDVKDILGKYDLGTDEKIIKYVYVDEKEGEESKQELGHAALYLSKYPQLPVLFVDGKPVGSQAKVKQLHESFDLEKVFINAGVFESPSCNELEVLKRTFPVLVLANNYSAYSLSVLEALEQFKIPKGNFKVVEESEHPDGQGLLRAAKMDSKVKTTPYIYVQGEHVPLEKFLAAVEANELKAFLRAKGVLG